MFDNKSILVTGGTGSFGKIFIQNLLGNNDIEKVVVYSRDELKQFEMQQSLDDKRVKYILGDIRDKERLFQSFHDIDIVVHAAAMKQVPASENNPMEAIKTNIMGAENIINVAIDQLIEKIDLHETYEIMSPSVKAVEVSSFLPSIFNTVR